MAQRWHAGGDGALRGPQSRPEGQQSERREPVVTIAGQAFLAGRDSGGEGWELWTTDATEAGTHLVRDIYPGPVGSEPVDFAPLGGLLAFWAYSEASFPTGRQAPFLSDGTPGGTRVAADLTRSWSAPSTFATAGGRIFLLVTENGTAAALWVLTDSP